MPPNGSLNPDDLPPASLATLIELDEVVPQRVWREEELGAVLAHELATPPWVELGPLRLSATSATHPTPGGLRLATVGDLLHHPDAPLELLVRLKDFAKQQRHSLQSHLPEPVAAALYALAAAAALVRHGQRVTSLGDEALRKHFRWAHDRPWMDSISRQLLAQAIARLSAAPAGD